MELSLSARPAPLFLDLSGTEFACKHAGAVNDTPRSLAATNRSESDTALAEAFSPRPVNVDSPKADCARSYACDNMFNMDNVEEVPVYRHHRQALRHYEDRDFSKSKEEFQKAVEADPNNAAVLSDFGVLWFFEQNIEEAVRCFEASLKYNPKHAGSLFNLGLICRGRGEFQTAKSHLELCLEQNPKHQHAMVVLSEVLSLEGHVAEADELRRRALTSR